MTDEELLEWLRDWHSPEHHLAADRIEKLVRERDALQSQVCDLRIALHQAQENARRPFDLTAENYALQNRVAELDGALSSIARNTCCDKCQEAAQKIVNQREEIKTLQARANAAEAKLANAAAALRYVVSVKGLTDPTGHGYDAIKHARIVLAELEKTE